MADEKLTTKERALLNRETQFLREIGDDNRATDISLRKIQKEHGQRLYNSLFSNKAELESNEYKLAQLRRGRDYLDLRKRIGERVLFRENLDKFLENLKKREISARLVGDELGANYYREQAASIRRETERLLRDGLLESGFEKEGVSGGGRGVRAFAETRWFKTVWPSEGVNLMVKTQPALDDYNRQVFRIDVAVSRPLSQLSEHEQNKIIKRTLVDLSKNLLKAAEAFESASKKSAQGLKLLEFKRLKK